MMSLTMTRAQGSRNQMSPSNRLLTKKEEGMKTTCERVVPWVVRVGEWAGASAGTVQAGPEGCPHRCRHTLAQRQKRKAAPPHQQDHVGPGVLPKLVRVPPLFQRQHKAASAEASAAASGGKGTHRSLPADPSQHSLCHLSCHCTTSPLNSCARACLPPPSDPTPPHLPACPSLPTQDPTPFTHPPHKPGGVQVVRDDCVALEQPAKHAGQAG